MKRTQVIAWLVILVLIALTLVPASERPVTGLPRKVEHLAAFALAGMLLAMAYPGRLLFLGAVAVGFPLILEIAQIPMPTRHARLSDFIVDAVGMIIGVFVARLWQIGVAARRTRASEPG